MTPESYLEKKKYQNTVKFTRYLYLEK